MSLLKIPRQFRCVKPAEFRLGFPVERKLHFGCLCAPDRRGRGQYEHATQNNLHEVSLSDVCHEPNVRAEMKLTAPTSTAPRSAEINTAAKTRSILCCVRAESTTLPSPPPPMNSPTMAPTTASPEAMRKPEKICGKAKGIDRKSVV